MLKLNSLKLARLLIIGVGEDFPAFIIQIRGILFIGEKTTWFQTLNLLKALYFSCKKIGAAIKIMAASSGIARSDVRFGKIHSVRCI